MNTTNGKAGATLAACAVFLLCLAGVGCNGVGAKRAAGQTEAAERPVDRRRALDAPSGERRNRRRPGRGA